MDLNAPIDVPRTARNSPAVPNVKTIISTVHASTVKGSRRVMTKPSKAAAVAENPCGAARTCAWSLISALP